jgi:glycosyltransferase involved in cell wall biosynthesis
MSNKVGGITTFLRGFIKHAPADFGVEHVGVTTRPEDRPVGRWTQLASEGRSFGFFPVLCESDINRKARVPLSLRFTAALAARRPDLSRRVLLFNRIEPAVLFPSRRPPKIGFVHNDIQKRVGPESEDTWRHLRWLYFAFERRVFRSMEHVYTVNRNSLKFYRATYPFLNGRLDFLPTWADLDLFHPAENRGHVRERIASQHNLPVSGAWVLFVGRLQEQKAPMRLIQTFAELKSGRNDAHLVIVGEGHLMDNAVREARRLGVFDSLRFIGSQPHHDLADFYRACDALLLTSNFEGMPRSVLEALASGLPVVSTDVGEVRAVVENGRSGEVCTDFAPAAIARSLEDVLADPQRYSAENCVNSVTAYTPAHVLAPVYDLCRKLSPSSTGTAS